MTTLDKAKQELKNNTLAIVCGESVGVYRDRGIKALLSVLSDTPDLLNGATVADKIVGKAAALLMVKGGVKEVYAEVMGEGAIEVFRKYRVPIAYGTIVANIINRSGTGLCPMEITVQNINEPDDAFRALTQAQSILTENAKIK
ncbi:MAG: DUF1893 domain-containing protein [Clostridiales bacterium]|nr:DUF1893 domain-containing protein [Clostridiales bacterium]